MTASLCRLAAVTVTGCLLVVAGCASSGEIAEGPPRLRWAGEGQTGETTAGAGWREAAGRGSGAAVFWAGPRVAVLPVHNLTAAPAPLKELERVLSEGLARRGAVVLDKQVLEAFMSKRRMRYTGGIDRETAAAMADETGAEAVLVSTLEYFEDGDPPKIALHARLVSTGPEPGILWMDRVCRAGDDAPGLLDMNLVDDPGDLSRRAAYDLTGSLMGQLAGEEQPVLSSAVDEGIPPTVFYREPGRVFNGGLTVAVMPFFNLSERPYAWEILPLHFVKGMLDSPGLKVLEPGVVRRALLRRRVMVRGGLSKPHLQLVLGATDADLVVSGTVMRYLDSPYPAIDPEVEFSVQVYEKKSQKVVWSSRSVGRGDDGIYFFNKGYRSTACSLSSELTRAAVAQMTSRADGELVSNIQEGMVP